MADASAGLSRGHFSEKFRGAYGISPHAYLLTRRLGGVVAPLEAR